MAQPCTPHLIAQRVQLFKLQARNAYFLWEGVREGYLFLKKRYPSLIRIPCAAQGMDAALADCTAHSAAEPRWGLLYDLPLLLLSAAALPVS